MAVAGRLTVGDWRPPPAVGAVAGRACSVARTARGLASLAVACVLVLTIALKVWGEGITSAAEIKVEDGGVLKMYSHHAQPAALSDIIGLQAEQETRLQQVKAVCSRNGVQAEVNNLVPERFQAIYVDERHKFLYCEVPKVACTNWKRIMLLLTGKMNTTNPMEISAADAHGDLGKKYLRRLSSYKPKDIKRILRNYLKVMFVRHPLERLLSAYRNKFTTYYNEYFHRRYGRKIVRLYRKNPSPEALKNGDDVTFKEFVKYVVDLKSSDESVNSHWREYYKLCHPCVVQYDVVGKYETLDRDVQYVLNILGMDKAIRFPPKPGYRGPSTQDLMISAFSNISSEDVHKLWETYIVDFTMFGYEYPDFSSHKP